MTDGRPSRRELADRNEWLRGYNQELTARLRAAEEAAESWERRALRLADDFVTRGRQDAEEMARLADQRDIALAALALPAGIDAA